MTLVPKHARACDMVLIRKLAHTMKNTRIRKAVLRCLYAYFMDVPLRHMPHLPISLHTVVKLTPGDYHGGSSSFWKELRFGLIKQTPLEQLAEATTI